MTSHDMTTPGDGSTSRLNSARMQQGSTENADRLITERRAESPAVSHNDMMAEHYAERNAAREAERADVEPPADFDAEELAARIFNRIHAPWL
ncbi:hypothetical protein [Streptomyces viridosporus]|uniref:hypothetical protein n=1 Tax=Streptomyces viridosporus TaxID=67581 RepID=UPI00117F996F|nr:hypothetical protein [Streptomyces viridosporus]